MRRNVFRGTMFLFFAFVALIFVVGPAYAGVQGPCSDCHTMHNSQNNQPMTYDGSATPNDVLLRGSCLGCHGQNKPQNIISNIPQVLHTNSVDLSGGNWAYTTGSKPPVTADANTAGHNVIDIGVPETVLTAPPGQQHEHGITNNNFTCAGTRGCHGVRNAIGNNRISGLGSLKGAHHGDDAMLKFGTINEAAQGDSIPHSYRFLFGVHGGEDNDWQNTVSATDHNEYKGASQPMDFGALGFTSNCAQCHSSTPPYADFAVRPLNNTMSGFCGTCHGNFHSLGATNPTLLGIGGNTTSPFTRHPTDVVLPSDTSKEYYLYNTPNGTSAGPYNVVVPVARQQIPNAPSATFTAGSDVVMCLSCHRAHATPYADILRWNYNDMIAGTQNSGGCFVCHTTKNATGVNP